MKLLHAIEELRAVPGPIHLAIGVFDGIHLGHQAVIATATERAKAIGGASIVLTFHPHPSQVLRPDRASRLLTSTQHKTHLIKRLGVDALLIQSFDLEFSHTTPDEFVALLVRNSDRLRTICVGDGWMFGANRTGNIDLLDELSKQYGFELHTIAPVEIDGAIVSSTRIREAVERGDFATAERLLGRPFTILGTVDTGQQLGRQLGFPTANLRAHNEQFPPNGVYAVVAWHASRQFGGVVNIGVRPTIQAATGERLLELHLFDFEQDIYGEDVEVQFLRFLRPEQKFADLDALRQQIGKDVAVARQVYSKLPE